MIERPILHGKELTMLEMIDRTHLLENQLASAREELKAVCDDVLVALAGSGVGTPEEGYFKESGRPWIKHDILKLREERDAFQKQRDTFKTQLSEQTDRLKKGNLLKWLDEQIAENEANRTTLVAQAQLGGPLERHLSGRIDALLAVKHFLQPEEKAPETKA